MPGLGIDGDLRIEQRHRIERKYLDRFAGELNVPDAFTRMLISLLSTGIVPRTFYADDGSGQRPRAHYDGLPADFVAEAITTIGANGLDGFRSYDVMNPHDDGISLDVIVDWLIEERRVNHPHRRPLRMDIAVRARAAESARAAAAAIGPGPA